MDLSEDRPPDAVPTVVHTLGHSTRSADELVALLREAGVEQLADVRRFPGSRRHPQHAREALERSLADAGLAYLWMGESLGGRVKAVLPVEESPNRAWTEPAFRHYADAMALPAFERGFSELCRRARETPTALMCAERLWWRCHRRLLADRLVVEGFRVVHWLEPGKASEHALCEWARVEEGKLRYPALL